MENDDLRLENTEKSVSATSAKKQGIVLWPAIVMLSVFVYYYAFFYNDNCKILAVLSAYGFFIYSLISAVYFLIRGKSKRSLSFVLPLIILMLLRPLAVREKLTYGRHYAEFLIHKRQLITDLKNENWPKYREWNLEQFGHKSQHDSSTTIFYDPEDKIDKAFYAAYIGKYRERIFAEYISYGFSPEDARKMADQWWSAKNCEDYKLGNNFYMREKWD